MVPAPGGRSLAVPGAEHQCGEDRRHEGRTDAQTGPPAPPSALPLLTSPGSEIGTGIGHVGSLPPGVIKQAARDRLGVVAARTCAATPPEDDLLPA